MVSLSVNPLFVLQIQEVTQITRVEVGVRLFTYMFVRRFVWGGVRPSVPIRILKFSTQFLNLHAL